MNSNKALLEEVFSKVIGTNPQLREKRREEIPSWDSLQHATLIIEIEKKIGRRFSVNEIERMNSFDEILKIINIQK